MAASLTSLAARMNRPFNFQYGNAASPYLARMGGNPTINLSKIWSYGSGAAQVNELYEELHTLSGSTPLDLDFRGGSDLLNPIKTAVSLSAIGYWYLENTGDEDLAISGDLCEALGIVTDYVLKPGEHLEGERFGATKYTVTGGSQDTLTITPTSGGELYVLVLGVAA